MSMTEKRDDRIDGPIGDAYGRYDSDPRVHGPDDFEAFADAVGSLVDAPGHQDIATRQAEKARRVIDLLDDIGFGKHPVHDSIEDYIDMMERTRGRA